MRRRGKRYWRFVRLEKTSFPKTESSLSSKSLKMKNEEKQWQSSKRRNKSKMKQITNSEFTTDPVVDPKPEIKHAVDLRVMEAPLSSLTQHEANRPTLFNEQRLEIVSRSACVSSPQTTIIINTITPIIIRMDSIREI